MHFYFVPSHQSWFLFGEYMSFWGSWLFPGGTHGLGQASHSFHPLATVIDLGWAFDPSYWNPIESQEFGWEYWASSLFGMNGVVWGSGSSSLDMKLLKILQSTKKNGWVLRLGWYISLHQMEMFPRKCPEMDCSRFSAVPHCKWCQLLLLGMRKKDIRFHTFVSWSVIDKRKNPGNKIIVAGAWWFQSFCYTWWNRDLGL